MAEENSINVTARDQGEWITVMGAPMMVKTDGAATGVFVADHSVAPGYAVPLHVHDRDDEMFWILEGALTLVGETGECSAGPGSFVLLPKGIPHGFRNDGSDDARFLVIASPGIGAAEMFRHFSRAGNAAPHEIAAIAAQYGVSMG